MINVDNGLNLNMRYLIEDLIIYDSSSKTLENVNYSGTHIELKPGSVAILLEFFLSHPDTIWGKGEIGTLAFADTIYSASESNVNKCLSILRRSFVETGADAGILKTIPLQGVSFNAKIAPCEGNDFPVKKSYSRKMIILSGFAVFSMIAIFIFLYFQNRSQTQAQAQICLIISRGDALPFEELNTLTPAIENCQSPGVIINGTNRFNESKENYSLISVCDSNHDECINDIKKAP